MNFMARVKEKRKLMKKKPNSDSGIVENNYVGIDG